MSGEAGRGVEQASNGTRLSGSVLGYQFDIRGSQAIVIAALLVVLVLLVYVGMGALETVKASMDRQGVTQITGAIESQTGKQSGEHKEVLSAIESHTVTAREQHADIDAKMGRMGDALEVQNYLILLDGEERREVKRRYKMPRALRDQLEEGPRRPTRGQ